MDRIVLEDLVVRRTSVTRYPVHCRQVYFTATLNYVRARMCIQSSALVRSSGRVEDYSQTVTFAADRGLSVG